MRLNECECSDVRNIKFFNTNLFSLTNLETPPTNITVKNHACHAFPLFVLRSSELRCEDLHVALRPAGKHV